MESDKEAVLLKAVGSNLLWLAWLEEPVLLSVILLAVAVYIHLVGAWQSILAIHSRRSLRRRRCGRALLL